MAGGGMGRGGGMGGRLGGMPMLPLPPGMLQMMGMRGAMGAPGGGMGLLPRWEARTRLWCRACFLSGICASLVPGRSLHSTGASGAARQPPRACGPRRAPAEHGTGPCATGAQAWAPAQC